MDFLKNRKKMLREEEVAELYGYSVKTLQGWRHKHIGPNYSKVGRSVRYDPKVVEEYFASKMIKTNG